MTWRFASARNGFLGDFQHFGRIFHAEAAEEPQLDHPAPARIDLGERCERPIQSLHLNATGYGAYEYPVQRDLHLSPASLGVAPFARAIHQNPPDHRRTQGKEMEAIPAVDSPCLDQPEVGLMRYAAGLQDVPRRLAAQLPPGDSAEIVINEGQESAGSRGG